MKLMIPIIQREFADEMFDALVAAQYRVTRLVIPGVFLLLQQRNVLPLGGIEDKQVDHVLAIIRQTPRDLGRLATARDQAATLSVFVCDLDEQIRL